MVAFIILILAISFEPKLAKSKKHTDFTILLYFWGVVPFFLQVDYIKGIFRPFVCYGLTAVISYNVAKSETGMNYGEFTRRMI